MNLCVLYGSIKTNIMRVSKSHLKDLIYQVNGAAIEVHKALGSGLLESVYYKCMKQELTLRHINFVSEKLVPVLYKGVEIDTELRCDFFIESILPLELKAVEKNLPVHEAQILTYMNLIKRSRRFAY